MSVCAGTTFHNDSPRGGNGFDPANGLKRTVMSQSPPERLLDFARRLLRHEAERAGGEDEVVASFQRVCSALHDRLAPLISSSGYHTLFTRALKLAARDFPFVAGVSIATNGDCALSGLQAADTRNPSEVADAFTAVLAHFIWLLVIFIGENLGLRKVREVWPEVPLDGVNPSSGAGT
jgi:hypothetical protein